MSSFIIHLFNLTISWYQTVISPDHGVFRAFFPSGVCRYQPTCSEYLRQAVLRDGWFGVWLGLKRLMRCHPFSRGGHDPLPHQNHY